MPPGTPMPEMVPRFGRSTSTLYSSELMNGTAPSTSGRSRPTLPWQHGTVGDERHQTQLRQPPAQKVRVLDRLDVKPRVLSIHAALRSREKRPAHHFGQLFQQHRLRCAGVYAPASGREAYSHAGFGVVGRGDHRGAGKDDLGRTLYLDPAAPARAPVSAYDASDGSFDAPRQEIFEGDPAHRVLEEVGIERVLFRSDTNKRRRGERVPLHPVHSEGERTEVVGAGEVSVGRVSFAVDALQSCPETLHYYPL